MANPTLTGRFLILIGNGASPEVFAFPCGANARSVKFTNSLGEQTLLDCADPLDGGVFVHRFLESQDTQITISGRLATQSLAMWRQWSDSGSAKNIRVEIDEPAARGGGYHTVKAYLQDFEISGEGNGNGSAEITATIMGTGERVFTAAS